MQHTITRVLLSLSLLLLFNACKEKCSDTISQSYTAYGFQSILVKNEYKVSLSYSPNFSVKATGCTEDLEGLRVHVINGVLNIYDPEDNEILKDVKVTIKIPVFSKLTLVDKATCTINGFTDTIPRTFDLSGTSICSFNGNASNVEVLADGNSHLTIAGNILSGNITVSNDAVYDAKNTSGNSITTISAGGESTSYVYALDTLTATASGLSRIYYKGDPTQKNFTETGQGKILPL